MRCLGATVYGFQHPSGTQNQDVPQWRLGNFTLPIEPLLQDGIAQGQETKNPIP